MTKKPDAEKPATDGYRYSSSYDRDLDALTM